MTALPSRVVARQRRGRGMRGPLLPPAIPRYRTRRDAFDEAVIRTYGPLRRRFDVELSGLDIAVDEIPRMRLRADMTVLPDDIASDGPVPLGRVISAGVDREGLPTRARLVLFRRPIELRCNTPADYDELLGRVLKALVASYMNVTVDIIEKEMSSGA